MLSTVVFRSGEILIQIASTVFFGASVLSLVSLVGGVLHASLTIYGSYAARAMFGDELFDLLMTDDPTNWPAKSFLLLPITPMRLMSPSPNGLASCSSLFFVWPDMPPLAVREQLADSTQIQHVVPSFTSTTPNSLSFPRLGVILTLTGIAYDRLLSKLTHWLLEIKPQQIRNPRQPSPSLLESLRRLWVTITGRVAPVLGDRPGNPQNPPQPVQVANEPLPGEEEPNDRDLLERATRTSDLSMLNGLLIPFIAKGMGHLLYLASMHIPPLQRLLRIRPILPLGALSPSVPKLVPDPIGGIHNVWYWRWFTEQAMDGMDPVWIRNTVGLGIFVVGRDCLHLFHLWLTKRELASRHLKNRDFAGVDPAQLDLRPRS
ncbi:hypothetical protein PM082_002626 [Marasmius tenuissimus]|nr:hypothetical protein PM082_002626 [Marasmius tenuissimus]